MQLIENSDTRSMIYRHVKKGGLYMVLHWDARIEASPHDEAVVYKSLRNGQVWVRPLTEFMDGRFKCVSRDELEAWKGK